MPLEAPVTSASGRVGLVMVDVSAGRTRSGGVPVNNTLTGTLSWVASCLVKWRETNAKPDGDENSQMGGIGHTDRGRHLCHSAHSLAPGRGKSVHRVRVWLSRIRRAADLRAATTIGCVQAGGSVSPAARDPPGSRRVRTATSSG